MEEQHTHPEQKETNALDYTAHHLLLSQAMMLLSLLQRLRSMWFGVWAACDFQSWKSQTMPVGYTPLLKPLLFFYVSTAFFPFICLSFLYCLAYLCKFQIAYSISFVFSPKPFLCPLFSLKVSAWCSVSQHLSVKLISHGFPEGAQGRGNFHSTCFSWVVLSKNSVKTTQMRTKQWGKVSGKSKSSNIYSRK